MIYINNFSTTKKIVLDEITTAIDCIDMAQVESLVDEICSAEKVFFVGVGRVLLALEAWVKRLNHLGIHANYVGAINEPAITNKDLLIIGSGSGETAIPVAIAKIASRYGAKIIHIGSNPNSSISQLTHLFIRIPCRTKLNLPGEIDSLQPMSSLFEQSLFLLGDMVSYMIIENKNLDLKKLWHSHANLE